MGRLAAYAARAQGAEVILVDRFSIGLGTNTALANALFTNPGPKYSRHEYCRDTISIGN